MSGVPYLAVLGIMTAALFVLGLNYLYGVISWAKNKLKIPHSVLKNDIFVDQNGYSWDFVLVFKIWEEHKKKELNQYQETFSMRNVVGRLTDGGLETRLFFSKLKDEVYVKIRGSPKRLMAEASRIKYSLRLNPERVRNKAQFGKRIDGKTIWKPINIVDNCNQVKTNYRYYDYIYGKYDANPEFQSIWSTNSDGSIFRGVDRIKLLISCMQAKTSENPPGCGLDLDQLTNRGCIKGAFCLHESSELYKVQRQWLKLFYFPWNLPVGDIKNYFGEKIGLYFAFLSHYVSMLLFPAVIGIVVFLIQQNDPRGFRYINVIYTCSMIIWNTLFLSSWKQKQATLSMEWGVTGYQNSEQYRPQYDGVPAKSPVDGSEFLYFRATTKAKRMNFSLSVTILLISCVLAYVAGVFLLQYEIGRGGKQYKLRGINFVNGMLQGGNAVIIQVLNIIYGRVAIKLNDYENHRTDTRYEDELIAKIFVFQVINSYSQILYVAFLQTTTEGNQCLPATDCMPEVSLTLGTIFITRILMTNLTTFASPLLKAYYHYFGKNDNLKESTQSPVEKEFLKEEYNVLIDTLKDYAEIVIQYGFTTMFIAALSVSPALAFVSGYIMIRVNGWKLCQAYRRPSPKTAESIGTWEVMIDIISVLAVISNIALLLFTASYFANLTWSSRLIVFVMTEACIFALKFMSKIFIPDVTQDIDLQLKRKDYLVSKILLNIADEFEDTFIHKENNVNLVINEIDPDWISQ